MRSKRKIITFSDNQASMALMKNPMYHARTKHIGIQFHFVRELIEAQEVEFEYCTTHELAADCLTKAVPRDKVEFCRIELGIVKVE